MGSVFGFSAGNLLRFPVPREVNLKIRSFGGRTIHPDISVALFHYTINGRQTEASAFSSFLGGKKRLKNVRQRFGIHAGSGVGNCQHHVLSGPGTGMIMRVCLVQFYVVGLVFEIAAWWLAVPR